MSRLQKSKQLIFVIGILISIIAVVISLKGIDWAGIPDAFARASWLPLLLLIPQFYLMYIVRAWRWRQLLPAANFKQSFDATMLGFFASLILPLRAGEFIRPWVLSNWTKIPMLKCFASIVVERVFDVLALMVILSISLSSVDLPENLALIVTGAKALMLIAGLISVLMIVAYLSPKWIESLVNLSCQIFLDKKFPQLSVKVKKLSSDFMEGLKVINSFSAFFKVVFSSLLLWVLMSFYYQIAIWAFDPKASILVGFTVNSIIALAVAAPSAPGFIGTFQLGCLIALKNIFGYSQELAIAFSVIVHLSQYLFTLLHGFYILKSQGLKLSQLNKSVD